MNELENLIIEAIYSGLLSGKMHHHEKVLHVDSVVGRDLRPEDLVKMQQSLTNWSVNFLHLLYDLIFIPTTSTGVPPHLHCYKLWTMRSWPSKARTLGRVTRTSGTCPKETTSSSITSHKRKQMGPDGTQDAGTMGVRG